MPPNTSMSYCLNPDCQNPTFNPEDTKFCLICGTSLLLDNRYRATKLLGAGGMGRNFLAVDERTPSKKRCVIKQFFPAVQIVNNPTAYQKAVELFNREAATLDTLGDKSSKIPRLLANIEQDKRLYFVQEFIDGQNLLQELQQQGTYTEEQIWQLLTELLPTLKFIHEHDVIHRDIKPENIMRRRDRELILIDFGISKELSGTVMSIGTTVGTVGYAPPEQMTYGESYSASDIYALGATCIHLLTGTFPNLLYNPQQQRWTWRDVMAAQGKTVSHQLGQILDKMLQQDIRQRYPTADAVLADLQVNPTITVTTPINIEPPLPSAKNNYKLLTGIGILITLVLGVIGYKLLQLSSQPQLTNTPPLETSNSSSPATSSLTTATQYYERGNELRKEGNNEGALEQYNKAIELDPKYLAAYNNRGNVRDDLGDKPGAIEDYNKSLELNPKYALAYYNRARVRNDLGEKQNALQDYNQSIELDPKYGFAYYGRGLVYNNLGDKKSALKDYDKAIELNPKYSAAYYARGNVRDDLGDKKGAILDYNQAIELNPEYTFAYYTRANVRNDVGDKKSALLDYDKALELNPKYVDAYNNRGIVREDLGDKSGAFQDYNKAIELDNKYANAYYNRANLYKKSDDKQNAIKDYNLAASLYQAQGNTKYYQYSLDHIKKLSQ
ncbi:tetratricopeptide repeat protein [Calothrix anomala FACHB-343]|uniref:Tetratricopeptide repeat protein n=2 Tax=Calothrix TaxID=1186 RepID=A0ABR8ARI2_9CYAN|nr:tetratricopeptide repeat protein [Calothrix anomala FACHB-343]